MLRGLLSMFLGGRLFRMLGGGRSGYGYHRFGTGWGTRHGGGFSSRSGLSRLFGQMGHRRRGWL